MWTGNDHHDNLVPSSIPVVNTSIPKIARVESRRGKFGRSGVNLDGKFSEGLNLVPAIYCWDKLGVDLKVSYWLIGNGRSFKQLIGYS